jgi:hypothetical protein
MSDLSSLLDKVNGPAKKKKKKSKTFNPKAKIDRSQIEVRSNSKAGKRKFKESVKDEKRLTHFIDAALDYISGDDVNLKSRHHNKVTTNGSDTRNWNLPGESLMNQHRNNFQKATYGRLHPDNANNDEGGRLKYFPKKDTRNPDLIAKYGSKGQKKKASLKRVEAASKKLRKSNLRRRVKAV